MASQQGRKQNRAESSKRMRLITALVVAAALFVFYLIDPTGFHRAMSMFLGEDLMTSPAPATGDAFQDGTLEVFFLDVGQGDSIFLRSPNGKTMLVDTGEAQYFGVIDTFLQEHGVTRIDALVETHPHSDHMGSMAKVVERYDIGVIYACPATNATSAFEKLLDAIEKKNVEIIAVYADEMPTLEWDRDTTVRVLSPFSDEEYDLNNSSIVLNIAYRNTSVLLSADAEKMAEEIMLARLSASSFSATILKLGHHGSSTSTSEAFFAAVDPEVVAIQVGAGNDYGHPHREIRTMLAQWGGPVYRTDLNGTIHFRLDGESFSVGVQK